MEYGGELILHAHHLEIPIQLVDIIIFPFIESLQEFLVYHVLSTFALRQFILQIGGSQVLEAFFLIAACETLQRFNVLLTVIAGFTERHDIHFLFHFVEEENGIEELPELIEELIAAPVRQSGSHVVCDLGTADIYLVPWILVEFITSHGISKRTQHLIHDHHQIGLDGTPGDGSSYEFVSWGITKSQLITPEVIILIMNGHICIPARIPNESLAVEFWSQIKFIIRYEITCIDILMTRKDLAVVKPVDKYIIE